jgi:hypothetical protein
VKARKYLSFLALTGGFMQRLFPLVRSRSYIDLLHPDDPINDIPHDTSKEGDITSPPVEDDQKWFHKCPQWQKIISLQGFETFVMKGNGFAISYNASCRKGNKFFHSLTDKETSIVYKNQYYILNGDHRAEYEKRIAKGYAHCKMYYFAHWNERSMWSSDNDFVNLEDFYHLCPS